MQPEPMRILEEDELKMSKKQIAVRHYHLTSKALRYVIALKEYEKKLDELSKLTDEEIMKLAEEENVN